MQTVILEKNTRTKNMYASLCVLSYERLPYLKRMMESLLEIKAGVEYELIVHDDGSDPEVKDYLYTLLKEGKISYLILNGGKNRGIGEAVRNCFKVASGDYLFKLDTDLEFKEGWLKTAVDILDKPDVGCVSLLNYNNYNPEDDRFKTREDRGDYLIVSDFISCLYGVRRAIYEKNKDSLDTDGWHKTIDNYPFEPWDKGEQLAISKEDMITNFGFGLGKSIYVKQNEKGEIVTTETHKEPLIF